jgi:hypothetical protein
VEGIRRAIHLYRTKDKKISIYVFGDEFTGPSIEQVVDTVDRIKPLRPDGERLVRIHGVGFSPPPRVMNEVPDLGILVAHSASLMRVLSTRNGETFVGLPQ